MMRKIGLITLVFLFIVSGFAQTKITINLKTTAQGKLEVSKGKLKSLVDLNKDIAGCAWVKKGTYVTNKSDCSAPPASYRLLDSSEKNKQIYLLVLSEAMGNCNVCAHGGGTNAFSLIWLKLDANLNLLQKKSVPIYWERLETYIVKPKPTTAKNLLVLKPKFVKDVLTVEYEKVNFDSNGKPINFDFSHLEYNRKIPEKAFIIKIEKRKKSTNTGK